MVSALLATFVMASTPPHQPTGYQAVPVPATQVRLQDNVWAPRIKTLLEASLDHQIKMCEDTGRLENYHAAVGKSTVSPDHQGYYFNDSDVYKIIEGAAYLLALHPDPVRQKRVQDIVDLIVAAQEPDGYLYTAKQVHAHGGKSPAREGRWVYEAHEHELYCFGHLYEAAVAWHQATGDHSLLDASVKNADLVLSVFNDDGLKNPPGHQEIEIGLVRLWQATGNEKYLQHAKWFLDQRGHREGRTESDYGIYAQDHLPVIEQTEAVGHAVRAAYQYMAMADVYAYLGEPAYAAALERIWESVSSSKLYLTGGIGATGEGEAFGAPYELPNLSAYQETCATIANAMWNQRLFQLYADGKYIDVTERALYNGLLSGFSQDCKAFFYPNPLQSTGAQRPEWYACACCPPNVLRVVPTVPSWIYALGDDRLFVNLYAANQSDLQIGNHKLKITQKTDYPWNGDIELTVDPETDAEFELSLRIPGWASDQPTPGDLYSFTDEAKTPFTLQINGQPVQADPEKGYVNLKRTWKKGDVVKLVLDARPRFVKADDRVEANQGRVALTMGPVVYCAEFADQPDGSVFHLLADPARPKTVTFDPSLLGGVNKLQIGGDTAARQPDGTVLRENKPRPVTLVPYGVWANRGSGQMTVWLPLNPQPDLPTK